MIDSRSCCSNQNHPNEDVYAFTKFSFFLSCAHSRCGMSQVIVSSLLLLSHMLLASHHELSENPARMSDLLHDP